MELGDIIKPVDQLEIRLLELARLERDTATIRFLFLDKYEETQDKSRFALALERLKVKGWIEGGHEDRWLITGAGVAALGREEIWEVLVTDLKSAPNPPGVTEVVGEIRKGVTVIAENFTIWRGGNFNGGGGVRFVARGSGRGTVRIVVDADPLEPGDLLKGERKGRRRARRDQRALWAFRYGRSLG